MRAERHADVAADERAQSGGLEHPADERRRRGLALGAGDGDDLAGEPPRGQFEFADDRHTGRPRRRERGQFRRHARTRHDEVGADEERRVVATQIECHAEAAQMVFAGNRRRAIGQRDLRAAGGQQLRRSQAAARRADDEHAPSAHRECPSLGPERRRGGHHRSFSVVRLSRAKRIAMMRKRVMTFGSLQPSSSKW